MQKESWNTIPRLYLRPDTSHSLIHLALYHMQKSCQVFKCYKIFNVFPGRSRGSFLLILQFESLEPEKMDWYNHRTYKQ